jgi:alkanesulfonate monooxygenase SsuD/methylene tetrahydromethanopterin reductase-like flavin-dependent oxidoreductase (luciferase family)
MTLAGLAALTSTIRLGSLVLANGLRPPTLLAKMIATLDQVAGGRLDVGIGAGWNEPDYAEQDLPLPGAGERLARLEEAAAVITAMLSADPGPGATWHGAHYWADRAPVVPGPVQKPWPPLWIGGSGDRLLGVVARVADGWNLAWRAEPGAYAARLEVLASRCAESGRDPATVRRTVGLATLIGRDADDLVGRWEALRRWAPGGALDGVELRDWAEGRLVGTADEVAGQLRTWAGLGVEQVICSFASLPFAVFDDEQLDLAAELVIPGLE